MQKPNFITMNYLPMLLPHKCKGNKLNYFSSEIQLKARNKDELNVF